MSSDNRWSGAFQRAEQAAGYMQIPRTIMWRMYALAGGQEPEFVSIEACPPEDDRALGRAVAVVFTDHLVVRADVAGVDLAASSGDKAVTDAVVFARRTLEWISHPHGLNPGSDNLRWLGPTGFSTREPVTLHYRGQQPITLPVMGGGGAFDVFYPSLLKDLAGGRD